MHFGKYGGGLGNSLSFSNRNSKKEMWQWAVSQQEISVAIGIIIKAAIMSPQAAAVEESILEGVASTVYYYVIGLIFCIIGYFITLLLNRKYDLNKEIGDGNPAAGIMTAGIFVGLAIVISGVIM